MERQQSEANRPAEMSNGQANIAKDLPTGQRYLQCFPLKQWWTWGPDAVAHMYSGRDRPHFAMSVRRVSVGY